MGTVTKGSYDTAEPLAIDAIRLARLLHVSLRHIRRMDSRGALPKAVRLGRAKRWAMDGPNGIRAWMEAGCPERKASEAISKRR